MQRHTWWVVALIIGFVVIIGSVPSGHTPIASRWNYNEHLFPIFRDRCGSCPHRRRCRSDVAGELSGGLPLDSIHP